MWVMGLEDHYCGDNRCPEQVWKQSLKVLGQELDLFMAIILFCNQFRCLAGVHWYSLMDLGRATLACYYLGSGPEYSKHLSSLHCTICLGQNKFVGSSKNHFMHKGPGPSRSCLLILLVKRISSSYTNFTPCDVKLLCMVTTTYHAQ